MCAEASGVCCPLTAAGACAVRSEHDREDMQPYLEGTGDPGQSVEELLLKYTRTTKPTADASPIYSARH
jgi:hypothetical protein